MPPSHSSWSTWKLFTTAAAFVSVAMAENVLKTSGFADCGTEAGITVEKLDLSYNHDTKLITFDLAGENDSPKSQFVSADLRIVAYGQDIYNNTFNPCDKANYISQLCPLPKGRFAARGEQKIPAEYADMVPSIAFQVPDIAAQATLKLIGVKEKEQVACLQSQVVNGKTVELPGVTYMAVGVVGAAFVVSGLSAASSAFAGGAAAGAGSGVPSPSFAETLGWFQGMAMNGMLSVEYPPLYRSFTKNFGFSAGIIPWQWLQTSIDDFRSKTGGDLSADSFQMLKNATLVFSDNSTDTPDTSIFKAKRAFDSFSQMASIVARDDELKISEIPMTVSGISAYAQQLSVPKSNTFMTVLLIVAICIAAIVVSILLVKCILEFWALFGSFPQALSGFREHYWGSMGRAITSLIMLLYGIWVLYCVFQFTQGDSWAAKTLAGVSLAIFTGILLLFTWRIWSTARQLKKEDGDSDRLYNDKETWVKYSLFYESYKKDYWWIFVPTIVYLFAKGLTLAVGDGHGMSQTIAQLVVEGVMLGLLIWSRPFERKSGNVIGIAIQVVRVLSVCCILVFVQQFGISQTTKTVTGLVLIIVQSTLTGLLVILIAWNAISACVRANPHRQRRKELEKKQRDLDALTPLDARNSLLLDRPKQEGDVSVFSVSAPIDEKDSRRSRSPDRYIAAEEGLRPANQLSSSPPTYRNLTHMDHTNDTQNLISSAAPVGWAYRDPSPPGMGRYDNYGSQKEQSYGYGNGGGYRGF